TSYIIPDLIIKAVDGDYAIVFNDQASPVLRINPYYYRMLRQAEDEETCQFLQEKYRSALWLIKSIEQRRMTVYRITRAIIDRQRDFLEKGIKHLHPMTMQDIAGAIDMHESTVSRATTDKYIQTPRGLFEMKFFFCRGIQDISSVSIKAMIVDYIDNEPPDAPYSDSGLARELAEKEGIELSRRTVSKYRNQLGIPSSTGRKNKNYSRKKEGFW
ncbi:MAG: RNA polymerase factor sigma-54, partial [Bacillota bacterium]